MNLLKQVSAGDLFGSHAAANGGRISPPGRPDGANGGGGPTVPVATNVHFGGCLGRRLWVSSTRADGTPRAFERHICSRPLCVCHFLPSNVYFALTSICPSAPVEPGASAYLRLQGSDWSCLGTEAVATTRDRQWSKCVQELWAPMDLAPRAGSTPFCETVDK